MSAYTAARAYRAAILAAAQTLYPADVLITRGPPAFDKYDDCISIGAPTVESEPATLSSSLRSREETLTLPLTISVWRAGGEEQEVDAETRAYAILQALETYVRITDTNLATASGVTGGIVRHCFLTAHAGDDVTPQDLLSRGRLYVIEATFTAVNRISGS